MFYFRRRSTFSESFGNRNSLWNRIFLTLVCRLQPTPKTHNKLELNWILRCRQTWKVSCFALASQRKKLNQSAYLLREALYRRKTQYKFQKWHTRHTDRQTERQWDRHGGRSTYFQNTNFSLRKHHNALKYKCKNKSNFNKNQIIKKRPPPWTQMDCKWWSWTSRKGQRLRMWTINNVIWSSLFCRLDHLLPGIQWIPRVNWRKSCACGDGNEKQCKKYMQIAAAIETDRFDGRKWNRKSFPLFPSLDEIFMPIWLIYIRCECK